MRAISTIIATIIIVSVSIVMAIAVAFWAMGIGGSFQKFEKVEFISIYPDPQAYYPGTLLQPDGNYFNGSAFTINIMLKNSGTAAATINNVFLNSRPYDTFANVTQSNLVNVTVSAGQQLNPKGIITLPYGTGVWTSGSTIEVAIQTAAGRSYSDFVVLP